MNLYNALLSKMVKHTLKILLCSHCKTFKAYLTIFVIMHEKINIETSEDNDELFEKNLPQADFQSCEHISN